MKVRNIKAVVPFKGYVVTQIRFEEVGAQINLEFDRRCGPRCPGCCSKLARNKASRRAVMDSPMPHGAIVMLTFPTVQGFCRKCDRFVTTCPEEVHPTCHATWRLMRQVNAWATLATNSEVAEASGLAPFQRLARGFIKQSARVCGFVKHGLSSGLIEGFNNLIERIIHKACGMRDLDYLELKLRHRSVMR